MRFRSTNHQCPEVSLREAVLRGLAADGGLYMPAVMPELPAEFFARLGGMTLPQIGFEVGKLFLGEDVPEDIIHTIVAKALNFPAPLVTLSGGFHVLELFHGPTLAFKDFGARFMARLMGYFVRDAEKELTVLAATSGDTGSAVAHGFFGVPGIRVVILYPSGRVSKAQEKQFTTLGGNIAALEVAGSFDDCQRLAKKALTDADLAGSLSLTSANSINIARLIPQMFYYFGACAQLKESASPVVLSVPSGNFGNLTAGVMAKCMGLRVAQFIAATNANDVVPQYLKDGEFRPQPSRRTISNAMDVGNPSNFARMTDLYEDNLTALRADVWGAGFSDAETEHAMRVTKEQSAYLLDPHTAVGLLGLRAFQRERNTSCQGIILGTAHPAKFAEVVERATGARVPVPEPLAECLSRPGQSVPLANRYADLREFLLA
ncbi:MAG TPA: threonine synthase [Candidatus Acidoferrales bacterium]|nr:threonine synthase [Candidatus Acidoferrales bacterium]